jgi:hypothetical protein
MAGFPGRQLPGIVSRRYHAEMKRWGLLLVGASVGALVGAQVGSAAILLALVAVVALRAARMSHDRLCTVSRTVELGTPIDTRTVPPPAG